MSSSKERKGELETKVEMTPMIDVTFLLLIFFLCSIRFRVVEGHLPSLLPRDVGVNTMPVTAQLEWIEVEVSRIVAVETHDAAGKSLPWDWSERQVRLKVQGLPLTGPGELEALVRKVVVNHPEVHITVFFSAGALYEDGVRVVEALKSAGAESIHFATAP